MNLQGWRTGQVDWPSAVWPRAEKRLSEGVGQPPGPWRGAQQKCPPQVRGVCRGVWWRCRRTGLEEVWQAVLEEWPRMNGVERKSRKTGARK